MGPRGSGLTTLVDRYGGVSGIISEYQVLSPQVSVAESRLHLSPALAPVFRLRMEIGRGEPRGVDVRREPWWPGVLLSQMSESERWAS